ncbi:MAG: 3-methyl-2-oxobutanoate dehydrogenase subunit VorB [Chitinispirillaceae bacterium]|nr:3-methyl-2-oxobutanoate dehydrogenase subunit VorB [Chitinispirillaceae bacterium]
MNKQLVMGNEAVVYGALLGGATHFFGYPITPASEIAHAAAYYFPRAGRFFLQAESEVSTINMMYGAAAAGSRPMTASSGPGISLMGEGISYMAGAELPGVIVDVQRVGPGLGYIWPEQGDYNMVVKGGGHGSYRTMVFAPNSVQEMCDFTYRAFDIADTYRMTVVILSDAYIGQMMEPLVLPAAVKQGAQKEWAVRGDCESRKNIITSIYVSPQVLSAHNLKLQAKYRRLEQEMVEYEETETGDAEILIVAFGISARVCFSALQQLRKQGCRAGMLRPKTLFPFPGKAVEALASRVKKIVVVELNNGQMADDVERAAAGRCPVLRYNWFGGIIPSSETITGMVLNDTARTGP